MQQEWYKTWQKNGWRNSQKKPVENKDLWERLIALISGLNVTFDKVKGHSGVQLNEEVDMLAQRGAYKLKEGNNG
jgi:ribonuclease HI